MERRIPNNDMRTAEDIIKRKKSAALISVAADTIIYEAVELMVSNKVGAMLIMEDGNITGIWTERDLLRNVVNEDFDPKTARIGDYMTTGLQSAPSTDSVYQLMDRFLGLYLRHLLVEKDGEHIGLISIGDVVKACIREKNQELKDLNTIVSWEYYEDWKWHEDKK